SLPLFFFFLLRRPPPPSTLFPYTTLFRSNYSPPTVTANGRPRVEGKFIFAGDEKLYVRGVTYGTFRPDATGQQFPSPEVVESDLDRKSTRLNSSHVKISYAVFCLKKKNKY